LALLLLCAPALGLEKFDFGWKFQLGNVANEDMCPSSAFPTNLNGYTCAGWAHQAAYEMTVDECRLYCCGDPTCAGWTFDPNSGYCAIGVSLDACTNTQNGTSGGGRPIPASIPMPPSTGPQAQNYSDADWQDVNTPHDFIVQQAPSPNGEWNHGYRPKNISWYRKTFTLGEEYKGKRVSVVFDGVYRSSDMWANGIYLGHHSSGYTSFEYRLDNVVTIPGDITLAVRVDPRANEGWWYEGGGIYRHTWLKVSHLVHIPMWGTYVTANVTGAISGLRADADLALSTEVVNADSTEHTGIVSVMVYDAAGSQVVSATSSPTQLPAGSQQTFSFSIQLSNAALWDLTSPSLYYAVFTVYRPSYEVDDSTNTSFGVRHLAFDANQGFFLNGNNVKVKGMCNHQDFAGVGTAVPDRISAYRIERQKELGVNAWRMSHNPPNPELLDAADRIGLLVWDENRFLGDFPQWKKDIEAMVRRDRNHPSIVWWSLCNEWGCMQDTMETTVRVGGEFRDILKKLDPTRPISGAWNGDVSGAVQWGKHVVDIGGINYNYDSFDPVHAQLPDQPMISSESCSCTSDRSPTVNLSLGIIGPYNAWSCIRDCWAPIAARAFVMGSFDWTGFDYRGEETPTVWPTISSHFGILDVAGFYKDDAYYYKSIFHSDPLVHIVPHSWNPPPPPTSNGYLSLIDCGTSSAELYTLWKFNPAQPGGSTVESLAQPGQCLVFAGSDVYPAYTAPCDPGNSSQIFQADAYGQISYQGQYCLDIQLQAGPNIGFFTCKNANSTNQDWSYSPLNNQISSLYTGYGSQCIGYMDGSIIAVWVYTNGDTVELLLNGLSYGNQSIGQFEKATFLVPYTPGELVARAYKQQNAWAMDVLGTTGAPAAIQLSVERPMDGEALRADGQDAALLVVKVVDENGAVVPDANNVIHYAVSGAGQLLGTGNGDPSDRDPEQVPRRRVWNG